MPNILEVIKDLKALQAKEAAGTATAADKARIKELQGYMSGSKKPDPAAAGPPLRPPAAKPTAPAPAAAKPVPVASARPPARPAPARPARDPGDPDTGAFRLSLDDDLMNALGEVEPGEDAAPVNATTHDAADVETSNPFAIDLGAAGLDDEPDESDAARTTFEVAEEVSARGAKAASNPFALEVPEDLDKIDLPEDNQGGVTHELADDELDDVAVTGDPYKVNVKDDFARALSKADGKGAGAAPSSQGPKGAPMVPDAHYEKIAATETSVVVQLRDGRIAKGVAGAFAPTAPSFTLNQLVAGTKPVAMKLEDCLTVRFVRNYNAGAGASAPFPAKPLPAAGEKVTVKLLDGETLVGNALPHKDGESFILLPVNATGNVRRIWVSAKAVRSYAKMP